MGIIIMAEKGAHQRKGQSFENLTESQQESAYFNMQSSYDPMVYETNCYVLLQIIGMLILFYIFNSLHWIACFVFGVSYTETYMVYSICIFVTAVLNILGMLCVGAAVNKKKLTHDYYAEKISEERQRQAEAAIKAQAKAAHEAKKLTKA